MSEISERYSRLSGQFAARIAAVPEDSWANQTPCPDWTVRDLVKHVIESQAMFLGLVGREMPPLPEAPAEAWDTARAAIQSDLEDPERAAAEYEGSFGRSTFERAVDGFLSMDLVVHGWDLAMATGQDEEIDASEIKQVLAQSEALGDAMRGPGAFGPALEPPAGADDKTRMLAFLGRRA